MSKPAYSPLLTLKVGKRKWVLTKDWHTPYGIVPEGTTTNGANVPRFLWWFLDPATEAFEASVLHDYFYQQALHTKQFADDAFYQTLLAYKVPAHKAKPAYLAVKMFGRGNYPKTKEQ